MGNFIIQNLIYFRQKIKAIFSDSKQTVISLIDAIAAQKNGDSIVKMSLSSLFTEVPADGHLTIYK